MVAREAMRAEEAETRRDWDGLGMGLLRFKHGFDCGENSGAEAAMLPFALCLGYASIPVECPAVYNWTVLHGARRTRATLPAARASKTSAALRSRDPFELLPAIFQEIPQ